MEAVLEFCPSVFGVDLKLLVSQYFRNCGGAIDAKLFGYVVGIADGSFSSPFGAS